MDQTVLLTILAIAASILSAGGIVGQVVGWRRARDEKAEERRKAEALAHAEEVKALAVAEADKAKSKTADRIDEREQTGRFQQRLIDRIDQLDRDHKQNSAKIEDLVRDHAECERRYTDLERKHTALEGKTAALEEKHRSLVRDHENLRDDHAQLQGHVKQVESDNRVLRQRLEGHPYDDEIEPVSRTNTLDRAGLGLAAAKAARRVRGEEG